MRSVPAIRARLRPALRSAFVSSPGTRPGRVTARVTLAGRPSPSKRRTRRRPEVGRALQRGSDGSPRRPETPCRPSSRPGKIVLDHAGGDRDGAGRGRRRDRPILAQDVVAPWGSPIVEQPGDGRVRRPGGGCELPRASRPLGLHPRGCGRRRAAGPRHRREDPLRGAAASWRGQRRPVRGCRGARRDRRTVQSSGGPART